MATRQKWNHSDQDGAVAIEKILQYWRLCLKESRDETPGDGFLLSAQTQPPIDPTQIKALDLEKAATGHQHHFDLTSESPFTLVSVPF